MKKATSVGGVIVRNHNTEPEVLLIRALEYDDWFLPKGHKEEGESLEQTALREIEEETGLIDLEIKEYLGDFEHHSKQANEMKTEKYFLISKTSNTEPRIEPGQNWEIKWFSKENLPVFYIEGQEKIVRKALAKIENMA
jgi:ADP-ribose pyrophosphatase YjhB (NUDIX family)